MTAQYCGQLTNHSSPGPLVGLADEVPRVLELPDLQPHLLLLLDHGLAARRRGRGQGLHQRGGRGVQRVLQRAHLPRRFRLAQIEPGPGRGH